MSYFETWKMSHFLGQIIKNQIMSVGVFRELFFGKTKVHTSYWFKALGDLFNKY